MTDSSHDALRDFAIGYVLGEMTLAERVDFESRLGGDADARAEVAAFRAALEALAACVPQIEPPARVRARVLDEIDVPRAEVAAEVPGRASRTGWGPWMAAAASLVLAVGIGGYALQLRRDVQQLEGHLAQAVIALDRAQTRLATTEQGMVTARVSLAVLTSPDIVRVDLGGQSVASAARGRAFWSRTSGVVFVATDVPQAPLGKTYQLWMVPATGAPVSAGLALPDAAGRVSIVAQTPADVAAPAAFAITLEPAGGVPAPTGDKYLVGLVTPNAP